MIGVVYGRFEPELRHVDEMCPHGCTAVDIGVWYGPWSRRLARRAAVVCAIEPMPHLAKILRETLPENVTLVEAAASDHEGEAQIWTTAETRGTEGVSSLIKRDRHTDSQRVAVTTVDSLHLKNVGFIKVDVDGNEIAALLGARETIERDKPNILVEVEERIQPVRTVIDTLANWDYHGWVLSKAGWVPVKDFDLVEHQRATVFVADKGLFRRALWPRPRYVNLVLFLPGGRTPV